MSQASVIINVSNQPQTHSNGLSGTWVVPGKKQGEDFAILVVYPTPEIQDIGNQRRIMHWLKAAPLAMDIIGLRSDAASHGQGSPGTKEKWGLLMCEAEPDLPKELILAFEEEIEFLNHNMPDVKMRKDGQTGAVVAVNIEDLSVKTRKIELSINVQTLREMFEDDCRKLVQRSEVQLARKHLLIEDQRMVAEADKMWASGKDAQRSSINELHQGSCTRLGQERPWCYVPQQLVDCPGCGAKIKENILSCPACGGWLEEGIKELAALHPKQRAPKMYPERYAEPVAASGPTQGQVKK